MHVLCLHRWELLNKLNTSKANSPEIKCWCYQQNLTNFQHKLAECAEATTQFYLALKSGKIGIAMNRPDTYMRIRK